MTTLDWTGQLLGQLTWHWEHQLRPRLDGLTDDEYFWEPVADAWTLRPRGTGSATMPGGAGAYTVDFAYPAPDPAPVTTIAWRLAHVIVGVFAMRNATHFGGPPTDFDTFDHAGTAGAALAQLDREYARWVDGVRGLDAEGLAAPCGEHGYADEPMAALVLHIHREVIHHGAELSLLRDLYRRRV
ncbi:DinB family protein [Actinocatenispora rupis]|uniref:DinB-like domain-containing protein n=1 Tax=Actinocatenispora rupis TaxID=519421 RepID=A0A8J3NAS2_9ACTN|nr:hypothetical protein Aru02nite_32850 [Actinocatenispora rupis]